MDSQWMGAAVGNFRKGRFGHTVTGIVIHVMDGTLIGTRMWFNTVGAGVSSHYGIGQLGELDQYVKEEDEAFHAGTVDNPTWPPAQAGINPNLFTVGIEHAGLATQIWTDAQYTVSAALIADICKRYSLPIDRQHVIGHHEIRAGKTCPGKGDVDRLVQMALAI